MNAYNVKDSVTVILFSPSFGTCIYILSTYSSSTYYIYLGITHSGPWKRVVLDLSHTLLRSLPSVFESSASAASPASADRGTSAVEGGAMVTFLPDEVLLVPK
jgi:hypothetical protein